MRNALGGILCAHRTAASIAGVNNDAAKREEGPFDAEALAKGDDAPLPCEAFSGDGEMMRSNPKRRVRGVMANGTCDILNEQQDDRTCGQYTGEWARRKKHTHTDTLSPPPSLPSPSRNSSQRHTPSARLRQPFDVDG